MIATLFKDTQYDTWAKRSPFANSPDAQAFKTEQTAYDVLVSLILQADFNFTLNHDQSVTVDVLAPALQLLHGGMLSTQSAWETTVEEYDFHKTGMTVPGYCAVQPVEKAQPIQLTTFKRLIGYRYQYSAVTDAQLQAMITAYKQHIGNNTSLGGEGMAGEYNLANNPANFAMYFASRAQLSAGGSTFPANIQLNANGGINPDVPQENQGFLRPGYLCGVKLLDDNLLHFKPGFTQDDQDD